jgi:hypothetical protein
MNLNSHIFDRIRVKPERKQAARPQGPTCDHPGCNEPGEFRAPMGRLREGQYFCFCLDHVREYNASYNYFNGMSAEAVAHYQRDAAIGHRPTWAMGAKRPRRTSFESSDLRSQFAETLSMSQTRQTPDSGCEPRHPRYGIAALKALDQLGLDESADAVAIKTRYKDLVKRLHPDANGGDRSNEEKLREIIRAYHYLRRVNPA